MFAGDNESRPFADALSQLSYSVGRENFCLIHVTLVPVLSVVGEQVCLYISSNEVYIFA